MARRLQLTAAMTQPGPWENLPPRPRPESPHRGGPSRLGWALWLGGMAGLGLLLFLLDRWFPGIRNGADNAYLVQTLILLALFSSSLLFVRQTNWRRGARYAGLWLLVGAVLILGYAYQDPLKNIALHLRSQIVPGYAVATGERELTISESDGGSYMVFGSVNGAQIRFLVDTGASDIVLDPSDARRAGIDTGALRYDRRFATANGVGSGATVTVDRLTVGAITLSDVPVSVQRAEMGVSLLGMDFLRRLKSYSVQDRKLILRW
jgi:aspartyl protease family protein